MLNGRLAYVLPPVTYSTRFSTIFILPWFVCTRMDIVPCAGAMYNISDRNEPFPFHCGPFPFFCPGLHTEWSFGLGFHLPWPIAHVLRLFSPQQGQFEPGWTWNHVWLPCTTIFHWNQPFLFPLGKFHSMNQGYKPSCLSTNSHDQYHT